MQMHFRIVLRWSLRACGALVLPSAILAQHDPLDGPIRLSVGERIVVGWSPQKVLSVTTEGEYGCMNLAIDAQLELRRDTVAINIRGLVPETICDNAFGPATRGFSLEVPDGNYSILVTRGHDIDRAHLTIAPDRMQIRGDSVLRFIRPDTSIFWRVPQRSFMLSCGTPNEPKLCADIEHWLTQQTGIHELQIPATGRIAFARGRETWQSEFRLYGYDADTTLAGVRRCMQGIANAVASAVGVVIEIATASGERMTAWSKRAFHEPHVAVPTRVTTSCQ